LRLVGILWLTHLPDAAHTEWFGLIITRALKPNNAYAQHNCTLSPVLNIIIM